VVFNQSQALGWGRGSEGVVEDPGMRRFIFSKKKFFNTYKCRKRFKLQPHKKIEIDLSESVFKYQKTAIFPKTREGIRAQFQ